MHSYSFDRAASFYDDTRKLPDGISAKITQAILDLAPTDRAILECGVGTGRMAAPLVKRGANVVGVDLSVVMMRRLREKVPGAPLAQADVSRLPFSHGSFDMLITVHVLHLVGPWRQALREFKRVLRPGGMYLNSHNYRPADAPNRQLRRHWHELIEARGQSGRRPGVKDHGELLTELHSMGARVEALEVGRWRQTTTAQKELDEIAERIHSDTWSVSDKILSETLAELREWALAQYDDLNAPIVIERRFIFDIVHF